MDRIADKRGGASETTIGKKVLPTKLSPEEAWCHKQWPKWSLEKGTICKTQKRKKALEQWDALSRLSIKWRLRSSLPRSYLFFHRKGKDFIGKYQEGT